MLMTLMTLNLYLSLLYLDGKKHMVIPQLSLIFKPLEDKMATMIAASKAARSTALRMDNAVHNGEHGPHGLLL